MAHLTQDTITEILVLLPVESLYRFMCVSKTWLSLISSPYFIKYHLQISSKTIKEDGNQKFILMFTKANQLRIINSYTCSLKPLTLDKCLKDVKTAKLGLDSDKFKSFPSSFRIVGSCNGVCCIQVHSYIILWNPSIRKLKHVRSLPNRFDYRFGDFGFAYDEFTDDYRVVELRSRRYDSGIIDYSLRKDSWKRIHDECDIMSPVVSKCCPFVGGESTLVVGKI
ncbi:hypothetical protein LIER_21435 [Lithospermum erythrorhizon]|uniref:F-box domain-containing protein n=1 Tax=Lithospermum erythrorhizon TaxID=34254 RepID=A0AAV3QUC6_LITER